jgi:hypothetical protein
MDFLIKIKSHTFNFREKINLCFVWFVIIIGAMSFFQCPACFSQTEIYENPTTYEVMAAFLYNFAKFVDWTPEALPDSLKTINIGILGDDPFEGYLQQITIDKFVKNRKLIVKNIRNINEIKLCHILFISQGEQSRLARILKRVEKLNILTVSDIDKFAQYGGMINFIVREDKVRFIINVDAVAAANLKISSKLLNLAEIFRNLENRKEN